LVRPTTSQAAATERKRLEERLAYLAYHDELTGQANRASFLERLEGAIARADREGSGVAVFYPDLDRFKEVNDSFGHGVGDGLLKARCSRRWPNACEGPCASQRTVSQGSGAMSFARCSKGRPPPGRARTSPPG
jgi:predicted signal transduction protein with EAL and GGDEF domain